MVTTRRHATIRKEKPKEQLKKRLTEELAGMKLLGEAIWWTPGKEETNHSKLISCLTEAKLDPEVARKLLPRYAFTRAAKKLTEQKVLDEVKDEGDSICFQLTKREMQKGEWHYKKETTITLDKETGKITCPIPEIEEFAQKELDKCIEARTTNDVSKVVMKLFDNNADIWPLRNNGGFYFVPIEHEKFTSKIEDFFSRLGGRVERLPIPAGSSRGDKAVASSVASGFKDLIDKHNESVEKFGTDTRSDTLKRSADEIKSLRIKLEAHALLLQDQKESIQAYLDEADAKLTEKVSSISEDRKSMPAGSSSSGARAYLFGWPITLVIRWMARKRRSWSFKETRKVLDALGFEGTADKTIDTQRYYGRRTDHTVPDLTKDDIKKLEKTYKKVTATKDDEDE